MIIHDVAQGTSAWLDLRKGIPTASCFDKIMTAGKRKSESREKYMAHLLAERILGFPIDGFKSAAMEHGNAHEECVIASYELHSEWETYRVGFVTTDDGRIGCSPDRFIVERPEGMVQAKAPTPAVQVLYLLSSVGASKEYAVQLQGELWVCEKEWNDIVTSCPGMPDAMFRVHRDEEFITELAAHVRAFSEQLEERAADFKQRGWIKLPAPVPEVTVGAFITEDDVEVLMNHYQRTGVFDSASR